MKLAKILAAAAISAAFAAPASAAVLGAADLTIQQLVILTPGGAPLNPALINIQSESRTGNASADFNGVSVSSGNVTTNVIGATLDLPPSIVGPGAGAVPGIYGGVVNNNLTTHLAAPSANYALADMYIQGSAVNASGAAGLTRADASIVNGAGQGGANTTIANSAVANTTFAVTAPVQAQFAITYDLFVNAFVDALAPGQTGLASSTVSYSLTLRENGNVILSFTPDELNEGAISNSSGTNAMVSNSGTVFSSFVTLTANKLYSLTINQASNATATQSAEVPEPGTMFLSALGLLAAGAAARRRIRN
jgi:hypothetical protein